MKFFQKLFWAFVALIVPAFASAQLRPGQEHVSVGGDSRATVTSTGPGSFVIDQTAIEVVYLNEVPNGIAVGPGKKDTSGKGTAYLAKIAANPALQGKRLCYNGVGSDWGSRACASMNGDSAKVTMTFPANVKNVTFALVPRIYDGEAPLAWASHSKDLRHQLACPGLANGQTDMASVLRIDDNSQVRPATPAEVAAYQPHYVKFCAIEGRSMTSFGANQ